MPRLTGKILVSLKQNIEKASAADLDDAMADLEDVGLVEDDDALIKTSHLPTVMPEQLRREVAAMSAEHVALGKRIQSVLDEVFNRIEDAAAVKEAAELASAPRCHHCNQVLPPKRAKPSGR